MKWIRIFIPRIEYILLATIFWGSIANGPRILNFDGDLPRHILVGNLILQSHHVSTTDIFSFRTVGYPSIPHEWFSQVLFAWADDWLGLSGVVLLTGLIIMLTWSIVYYQAMRKSNSLFLSLIFIALAVGASQIHVLPRPHIFTYILTAIWITLLERMDQNDLRFWWLLPLVMLLWVNMHGMFVLGILILGIYLVGDFLDHPSIAWFTSTKTKSFLLVGILSILATFFSPTGPEIWNAIASFGGNAYITSRILDFQSANFHIPETWPFIFLLLLSIIGFARTTKKVPWVSILLFTSFIALALYTSRMMPLFTMVATPIAAEAFADWMKSEYPQSRFFIIEKNISKINSSSNGMIWIFAVAAMAVALFKSGIPIDSQSKGNVFDNRFFPVEAALWLETHPQEGRMFNEFDWGGYLLQRLWPSQQIFMDGHIHIYGEKLTREYEQVITLGTNWENIFTKYNIEWVIMRANAPLINALASSGNWSIAYQDQTAIILIRK